MNNSPKIRFNGYHEDWILKDFNELFLERHQIGNISKEYPQLSFTIADGVINPEDRKTNNRDFLILDKDNKKYLITEYNDIIYNPANVVYGAIHRNKLKKGVVSPIYRIFSTKEDPTFMECVVRNPNFIKQIARRTEGTVTKLKTLKPEAFLKMQSYIPTSKEEQAKIGKFLENLDVLIKNQSLKIEELNIFRNSILNKLIPNDSYNIPKIRFNGFHEEWNLKKLNELIRKPVTDGPHETPNLIKYGIPFISVEAIHDGTIDLSKCRGYISKEDDERYKRKYVPEIGDVLFTKAATIGRVAIVDNPNLNIWSPIGAIKPNNRLIFSDYLFYVLQTNMIQKNAILGSNSGSQYNLSMDKIEDFDIYIPSKIEEQKCIASLLGNIDKLIVLNKAKLDKYECLKISLLDKMFV